MEAESPSDSETDEDCSIIEVFGNEGAVPSEVHDEIDE
jgi:hypothetical protein